METEMEKKLRLAKELIEIYLDPKCLPKTEVDLECAILFIQDCMKINKNLSKGGSSKKMFAIVPMDEKDSIMPLADFLEKRNMLWEDFHEIKFYQYKLYPFTIFFFFEGKCWFTISDTRGATGQVDPNTLPENIKKEFDRYKETFPNLEL